MEITPGRSYGFFTDTSVCIGCKACEVACKTWNEIEGDPPAFGDGFDNTGEMGAKNWRHVQFIDNVPDEVVETNGGGTAWLMMSDVCKHCVEASCVQVCPTGALMRTEFDTVFVQKDVCNGCRDCTSACPYHVIQMDEEKGVAQKCTLCYDRLQVNMEPACAQTCPTDSINFGPVDELREMAKLRVEELHAQGTTQAYLYGHDESIYGGLNAFFLLMDKPEVYKLPNEENSVLPKRNNVPGYLGSIGAAALGIAGGLIAFKKRRDKVAEAESDHPPLAGATAGAPGSSPEGRES